MGLSFEQYARLTWRNFLFKLDGFFEHEGKNWERTRLIAYTVYATTVEKKEEIYDFLPLPGDPTQAERKRMKKKQLKKEESEAKRMIDYYKKEGWL